MEINTYTFRFEYSMEAQSAEDAAIKVARDLEDGYSFRSAVADVYGEDGKYIATIDMEKIFCHGKVTG